MYTSYFNSLPIGIVVADNKGQVIFINKMAQDLRKHEQIHTDSTLRIVIETKTEKLKVKRKIKNKSILINCYPVYEKNADFLGAIEILEEICSYEKIESEYNDIKELNDKLNIIISNSSDGIFVTDGNGRILTINQTSKNFIGVEDESYILGKSVDILEEEGFISSSAIKQAIKKKEKVTIFQTTRTGEKIIVTANPVFNDEGEITKVISNSRSITEILALKEQFMKEKELAEFYKRELEQRKHIEEIVAESSVMRAIINKAAKVADYDTTVLLLGESGVGKNQIANLIHKLSSRSKYPFVQINCSAIPFNLMESELFGYEGGAFSGAKKEGDIGKLELANNGTLFLDEIAELPLQQQAKLLHVINEKTFMRVGGKEKIQVNLRIISATNKDIEGLVNKGEFREDLYYRLNVIRIKIPSLRERKEDILILIKYYLDFFNKKYGENKSFSTQVLKLLENYEWPGNIRELKNVIEQMIILSENTTIVENDIPENISRNKSMLYKDIDNIRSLKALIEDTEKDVITTLYNKFRSSYKIADILNISQTTAMRKISKYINKDGEK